MRLNQLVKLNRLNQFSISQQLSPLNQSWGVNQLNPLNRLIKKTQPVKTAESIIIIKVLKSNIKNYTM